MEGNSEDWPGIDALRLLVVDDNAFDRWAVSNVLLALGARHVLSAADSRWAVKILDTAREPIDIVLCDLDRLDTDAMQLLRYIGKRGASVIRLERSLVTSIEMMAKAYGIRLLGAVRKPVKAGEVERLVRLYRQPRP